MNDPNGHGRELLTEGDKILTKLVIIVVWAVGLYVIVEMFK